MKFRSRGLAGTRIYYVRPRNPLRDVSLPDNHFTVTYPLIFEPAVTQETIDRVDRLTPDTQPEWGKMNVGQMLAHCNVAYDIDTGAIPTKHNFIMKFILRNFVKKSVVGPAPYKKNTRTAPVFMITEERDFEKEKARLIENLHRVQQLGAEYYEGRENPGFGRLTAYEWSVMYYKHLDHHLTQFGV